MSRLFVMISGANGDVWRYISKKNIRIIDLMEVLEAISTIYRPLGISISLTTFASLKNGDVMLKIAKTKKVDNII